MTVKKSIDELAQHQREVMDVVWEMGEATVHQVRDRINEHKNLAYTTILSVMQKLESEGWLKHRAEKRTYVYKPTVSREQAGARSIGQLIDSVFGGKPQLMFEHLLDEGNLSQDDVAELRKLISRKKRGG